MNLRRQHRLVAGFCVLVALAVFAVLFFSARAIEAAAEKSAFAARLDVQGIAGLRTLAVEYLLHADERPRRQWEAQHASLGAMIVSRYFVEPRERKLIEELRRRHALLGELFPRLVELNDLKSGEGISTSQAHDSESRVVTQILIATHDMASDAALLRELSQVELLAELRAVFGFVAVTVAAATAIVFAFLAYSKRSWIEPLGALRSGAERIGSGDLNHRTALRRDDEIGELSSSLDHMAQRLAANIEELRAKSRDLEIANAELEAFSYSVSHDLRAPLRGIDGWSLALAEDCGDRLDAEARSHLDFIRAEAQRMGRLIDDLLQLSRVSRHELRAGDVDLAAIARGVAKRLTAQHPDRAVTFDIPATLAARGDAHLLEIVLTNLMDNAVKFTARRAQATVALGCEDTDEPGTGRTLRAFYVRDDGEGFDMNHAGRLFGAFQRLHKASEFPGTGIGLATVQRIVRRHGGRTWAHARPGEGATFYFTLGEAS
jgi:signal transduction histidine kinase